jgi:DivIVA domain-containing protein
VDGETNETAEQPAATEDHLTADQLVDYLTRASFATTIGRRGYHQGEVGALLTRLAEDVQAGEPLADAVRRTRFTTVRLEDGYDQTQVDDFLAAVVDLDPHAAGAVRPEIARSGLIGKLFG